MRKAKILLGALSLTAIAPTMPMVLTSCGDGSNKITVALYANDGTFAGDKKIIYLNNVTKNTKLKDIAGYTQPTIKDLTFAFWRDANGNKVDPETKITDTTVLGAYYKEVAGVPTNFKEDNWATIAVACKDALTFAKAYIPNFAGETEDEAIAAIKTQIKTDALYTKEQKDSKVLTRKIKINSSTSTDTFEANIRLIGVGEDTAADGSAKTTFTFEFVDIIDVAMYNYTAGSFWYVEDAEGHETNSCMLRENCNKSLIKFLPTSVQESIVPVKKLVFRDGQHDASNKIYSTELLFPLSLEESGLTNSNTAEPIKDASCDGMNTYTHYLGLTGQARATYSSKYYYGLDGTKQFGESGEYPIIQYPMWLRSPYNNLKIYNYNPDNSRVYENYSNSGLGVAPAFCL